MDETQIQYLTTLVGTYLTAYGERMPERQASRRLWADRPVRQEYRAVLCFVRGQDEAAKRYADATIEAFVDDLLTAALREHARVEAEVRELAAILNHVLATRLYVPLDGVASDADTYDMGALRLVRMNDAAFEQLIVRPYAETMAANRHYGDEDRAGFVEHHRNGLDSLRGRVCAEVITGLDIPKTFEFAQASAIGDLCDFLQFVASLFVAHDKHLKIGWATDARTVWRHTFARSDDPRRHSNSYHERVSVGHPFYLTAERIESITGNGMLRIADAIGRQPPTEYDELLRRAVRWFAKGEREDNLDDRKLSYVTAVDLFFSEKGPGATQRLCTGFALALARHDDAVPRLAGYMSEIFDSRCATSHGGEFGIVEENELSTFRWHVQQFMIAMANKPFATKNDLKAWIKTRQQALTSGQ